MFTVEERDALRDRVLRLADEDERVVSGAVVGSLALGGGDRYSDLDLTFAVADDVPVADVLDDWTRVLVEEQEAVRLFNLEVGPTIYRVFVFPGALQFDLSMTPAAHFRPRSPRFRLLFGEAGEAQEATPAAAHDLFGWGVIYALHGRACIERGRVWQAEHAVCAMRDHALALACMRLGLPASEGRGYDDLPEDVLAGFENSHAGSTEPAALRKTHSACLAALLREGVEARLPHAVSVAERLAEL
jgi:hypothetical protein